MQNILRDDIVNHLRSYHLVSSDQIMKLREALQGLKSVSGLMTEEKGKKAFNDSYSILCTFF